MPQGGIIGKLHLNTFIEIFIYIYISWHCPTYLPLSAYPFLPLQVKVFKLQNIFRCKFLPHIPWAAHISTWYNAVYQIKFSQKLSSSHLFGFVLFLFNYYYFLHCCFKWNKRITLQSCHLCLRKTTIVSTIVLEDQTFF